MKKGWLLKLGLVVLVTGLALSTMGIQCPWDKDDDDDTTSGSSTPTTPDAPSSLNVTVISSSQIDLIWTDNSNNEDGFKIERKTGAGGTYTQIDTVNTNVTSYSDTGLSASTTYYYLVRAYNSAGVSSYSNEAFATTPAAFPPDAPSGLTANAVSSSQINLSWTDNSDNEDGFKIERKTGAGGTYSEITTADANVTSYNDTDVSASTTYYYLVKAYNTAGDSSYSNQASATTLAAFPPADPSGLTANAVSSSQIDLSWTDNSDNEDGFKIERSPDDVIYTQIDMVGPNVTSYPNTGLSASTIYYYQVRAYNTAGDSSYSNKDSATTQTPPVTLPNDPSDLTATAVSPSRINLSWADNSDNEDGFKIERKKGAGGTYSEIATVNVNVTVYNDTALSPSTTYYYQVRAYNSAGDSSYSNEPLAITGTTTHIAGGAYHSITLESNGTVWAWGLNYFGELGDGTTTHRLTPVQVSELTDVTTIAGGDFFTVAVRNDGTVWAWGNNEHGQLGIGSVDDPIPYTPHPTPVQVKGPGGIGFLSGITATACGRYSHTIALKTDGTVWIWGENDRGQLGDGTVISRTTPTQVITTTGLTTATAIAGGEWSTTALKSDGTVWNWGYNVYGQLGIDNADPDPHPTPVYVRDSSGITLTGVTAIACGRYHTFALKNDDTLWAWGFNSSGQLGDGTTTNKWTPVQVLSEVTAIACGIYHSLALKSDGTVWTWGYNKYGQLGVGTDDTDPYPTPVQVKGPGGVGFLTDVTEIAGGDYHCLVIKSDGTIWAWGANLWYELGDGTNISRSTPVQVSGP